MDIADAIAEAASNLALEKLRHDKDKLLGETIAKLKEESIKALLLSKGYITLDEVLAIIEPGWLPECLEPITLEFDAADETAKYGIMLNFDI